tara:strand:- start:1921 stop:3204 length:1284 start_codon:yes stop_codon:yes gene_type:complete
MKFTILTKWSDFLSHIEKNEESFKGLDANVQAEHFNTFNKGMKDAQNEAISLKASKSDLQDLQIKLAENQEKQFNALNSAIKSMGIKVAKSDGKGLSFKEELKNNLSENIEKLKELKDSKNGGFSFTTKAVGDMTSANISGGNVPLEDRIAGLSVLPTRRISLLDVMSARSTASNIVSWVSQANKEGQAGQTGEGLVKNQIDFDLVVASENVVKTTAFIKVTTEMLDDIDFIQSEIEAELMRELLLAVELGAYSGAGTGNTLNGVSTVATAFTGAGFVDLVDSPNVIDVLVASVNQIEEANNDSPNFAFLHPRVVNQLLTEKVTSTDKRYIDRLSNIAGSLVLDGVTRIIKTTLVPVDSFLIGDFNKALLVQKDGIKMDIGLSGDDFEKNFRTILAEWRGAVVVKTNDRTAFVKGAISTAKALILKP